MILENTRQGIHVDSVVLQGIKVPTEGPLGLERHQFPTEESLFAVVRQVVVKPLLGNLVQIGVKVVHVAIVCQKLDSRLGANFRDSRNVIASIAHKRQVVPNLFWRKSVLFYHLGRAKVYTIGALGQVEQVNLVGHNLGHVLVLRKNHHMVKAGLYCSGSHAGHHIVSLVTRLRKQGDSAGVQAFAQEGHLGGHFFGHGASIGLVVRIKFVPESLGVGYISGNGKMGGLVFCQDAEYRPPVTVHHRNVFALAVYQRILAVGVKHTEGKGVRIEKQ